MSAEAPHPDSFTQTLSRPAVRTATEVHVAKAISVMLGIKNNMIHVINHSAIYNYQTNIYKEVHYMSCEGPHRSNNKNQPK